MSACHRLLSSVDNLTYNSGEAEDNDRDYNGNTDLTQVADACELLHKGYRVGVGTFCAAKFVREESWCRVRITSVDADGVDVFYIDNDKTGTADVSNVQSLHKKFATLQT